MFHMKMLRRKQKKQTKGDGDISPVSAIDIERMWNICSSFARPPILFISISLSISLYVSLTTPPPLSLSLFSAASLVSHHFSIFSPFCLCALCALAFLPGNFSVEIANRAECAFRVATVFFLASLARTSFVASNIQPH